MVTIPIIPPSGVGKGNWNVKVESKGFALELSVLWRDRLLHMDILHRKWLDGAKIGVESQNTEPFTRVHPRYLALDGALRALRKTISDEVESIAHIPLLFEVETPIHFMIPIAYK